MNDYLDELAYDIGAIDVTALLRIPDVRRALVQDRPLAGRQEMHLAWDAESVSIAGERVPHVNTLPPTSSPWSPSWS